MVDFTLAVRAALGTFFRSRADLALEILAFRQQLAVLKRKRPPPPLSSSDRLFWIILRRFLALEIGQAPGAAKDHRGDPRTDSTFGRGAGWGAPKIHGELQKLGGIRGIGKNGRSLPPPPSPARQPQELADLPSESSRGDLALDFFTVPTITFRLLYCRS